MPTLKKIRYLLSRPVKIKIIILSIAIIFGSLLETVALSAMMPLIMLLLDSTSIETNPIIRYIYEFLPFKSQSALLAFMAFLLASAYAFRSVYGYILTKVQFRFLSRRQLELSEKMLTLILSKPYLYHVNKNLSELYRIITTDVTNLYLLITELLRIAADFFMFLFMSVFLLIISPVITILVICISLLCILVYYKVIKDKVEKTGEENRNKNILMGKAIIQPLYGVKELKIYRRESFFINRFKTEGYAYAVTNQKYQVYNAVPRFIIEGLFFGGAFLFIGILSLSGADVGGTVPILSIFVLAAFRILPAVSRFSGYVNNITFYMPSLDSLYKSLTDDGIIDSLYSKSVNDNNESADTDVSVNTPSNIASSFDIIADNVSFQYPDTTEPVLDSISLQIPYKKSTAFIGPTGGGKTTLADVILGIYKPLYGGVYHNGKSIHHNLDEWTSQIGYIPQTIYLIDETILENVAFGIPLDEIDEQRVWEALEKAQIADFIRSLPSGLQTIVGDRGVRLSGGQRQRIGIARALYNDPSILVLDEATSSLDNETEKAVMEAIEGFYGKKTMIIIAHRLSTIENCDIIYRVENGTVVREK